MKFIVTISFLFFILYSDCIAQSKKNTSSTYPKSKSFYTKELIDSDAVYFTPKILISKQMVQWMFLMFYKTLCMI